MLYFLKIAAFLYKKEALCLSVFVTFASQKQIADHPGESDPESKVFVSYLIICLDRFRLKSIFITKIKLF